MKHGNFFKMKLAPKEYAVTKDKNEVVHIQWHCTHHTWHGEKFLLCKGLPDHVVFIRELLDEAGYKNVTLNSTNI